MQNGSDVSGDSRGEGNTNPPPRSPLAKKWCFTLNNWSIFEYNDIIERINGGNGSNGSNVSNFYVIGKEKGDQGTPHLQGYIEMGKKIRPTEFFKNKRIHFEKVKGNRQQNIQYCIKEDDFATNFKIKETLEDEFISCTPYIYQKEILSIIKGKPASRTIYWFWEPNGNTGKSVFTKHLCLTYEALVLSGKSNDCKSAIVSLTEKQDGYTPKIIIFDYPRSSMGYINYACIEEIKNGCFFSGKYESAMFLMNKPHIFIFANEEPDYSKLSLDRWQVKRINIEDIETIDKFYE